MRKSFPSFFNIFLLVIFMTTTSVFYIFYQEKKSSTKSINEIFFRYADLMDKQISQSWFKTTIKLGAIYAVEKQLLDFSDDFFSQALIHNNDEIIGGFGYSISANKPPSGPIRGYFKSKNIIFFRVPIPSKNNTVVTFTVNKKFINKKFPTINSIQFLNKKREVYIKISVLLSFKENFLDIIILIIIFTTFGYMLISITNDFINSKREIERNDIQNHDLRESSFCIRSFLYWGKKYLKSPTIENKDIFMSEINELEISEEINERIYVNSRKRSGEFSQFNLNFEIKKIIFFLSIEMNLSQFHYEPIDDSIKVSSDLNSFTVLLINILKNALKEVVGDLVKNCELKIIEATDYIELLVINDGKIDKPHKVLRNKISYRGSSGLGLGIIKRQEKNMKTSVTLLDLKIKKKVVCSFPLQKVCI